MKCQADNYIHPRTARVIAAYLAALPGTQTQIRERSGLRESSTVKFTKRLHGAYMHIGHFVPHPRGGPSIPFYVAGQGEDAIDDLPRMTKQETSARYEARIKGTERDDVRKAKHRAQWWKKKAKATPQTPFSALFVGVRLPSVNVEG